MPEAHFKDLGYIDYKECWDLQEQIHQKQVQQKISNRKEKTNASIENHLLFCEHPHVYTLGKSGEFENLKVSINDLESIQAKYYHINRGGDITYHGPGQIVAYPIIDLEQFFTDLHKYLRCLEEAVILTLAEYKIEAGRFDGYTGVWLDADNERARKICAIGVKVSRWITLHGLAFNVNTDLSYFNHIVPCAIEDKAVTSLQEELGREINMDEVKAILKVNLANVFDIDYIE